MAPAGAESIWEKYGAFFNLFHPDVKQLIQRLEWLNYKIGRSNMSVQIYQTCLKEKMSPIYIYTCIHDRASGLMSRVFADGLGDQGSIPGRVIPMT